MLYREIIAICSEIHTKHINILYGQNVEFFYVRAGGIYGNQQPTELSRLRIISETWQLELFTEIK
jgi:hypothetical protein